MHWLHPLLLVIALTHCGGPQQGEASGGECFRDADCKEGLVCVAGACSNDVDPLVSIVEGPGMAAAGAAGGVGGTTSTTDANTTSNASTTGDMTGAGGMTSAGGMTGAGGAATATSTETLTTTTGVSGSAGAPP